MINFEYLEEFVEDVCDYVFVVVERWSLFRSDVVVAVSYHDVKNSDKEIVCFELIFSLKLSVHE